MKNLKFLFSLVLLLPLSISAQDTSDSANADVEEVVVVGSQIKGAKITGALPVSVITSDDIDSDGNFNTTFFAPQPQWFGDDINIIGQFDEVHVDGVMVMDEYFNIGKAVLVEDLIISDNTILPENYAGGEDFPIGGQTMMGGLNLQTTSYNTTTDNNLFPYFPVNYHLNFDSSFDDHQFEC